MESAFREASENRIDRFPSAEQVKKEYERTAGAERRQKIVRRVLLSLGAASAIAILVAILLLPILRIYGTSMTPTLYEGNIVVSIKSAYYHRGDIVSFYYNNSILVKRAIAFEGEWIDIDEEGNIYINGKELEEPYIEAKSFGNCTIDLPYQVPEKKVFVIGDHRATSKDSRSVDVGCIDKDKCVGKIIFRIWPLDSIGRVD